MSADDVRHMVRDFIRERFMVGLTADFVEDDDSLLEKGVIDSTAIMELVTFIEDQFRFPVLDDDIIPENLGTIDNIVSYIKKRIGIEN